jgi:hypothetical protein
VATTARPAGDAADGRTPVVRGTRSHTVDLGGATITDEDPADPPCPSLGTVWRRFVPTRTGRTLVAVSGGHATTLTAFAGRRPTGANVLDCVDREQQGEMQLNLRVRRGRPVWVRIGADTTSGGERARLRLADGSRTTVIDGGPGGFDPTTGGPGGGLPAVCDRADVDKARVGGSRLRGSAGALNRLARLNVGLRVRGASICNAEVRLYGPGGVYAKALVVRLKPGRNTVSLVRLRRLRPGAYRVEVRGISLRGKRVVVKGQPRGRYGR